MADLVVEKHRLEILYNESHCTFYFAAKNIPHAITIEEDMCYHKFAET